MEAYSKEQLLQLKEYFTIKRNYPRTTILGPGETITNMQIFLQSHLPFLDEEFQSAKWSYYDRLTKAKNALEQNATS
jgi:hypothetical protein